MHFFAGPIEVPGWFVVAYFLSYVLFAVIAVILAWQTILAIIKNKTAKDKLRRKYIAVFWIAVLLFVVFSGIVVIRQEQGHSKYNRETVTAYVQSYRYPIFVLDGSQDFNISFDKWGQLELLTDQYTIVQTPIAALNTANFYPEEGKCNLSADRGRYGSGFGEQPCSFVEELNGFKVYRNNFDGGGSYLVREDMVLVFYSNSSQSAVFDREMTMRLKPASKDELLILVPEKYEGNYIEVLDRWRREGKF